MATITSNGTGLASHTSSWDSGSVPAEGDKVIIASGDVITQITKVNEDDNITTTTTISWVDGVPTAIEEI